MAGILQHLRSSTLDKRPNPASMVDGQVAINYASGAPGMFFKDSNGALVKVGPVHVGSDAPNASPASGGTAGNSLGEQWLDTSGGTYVFKIWDGSAWRSEAGEFVNVSGDTMTGSLTMGSGATIIFEGATDDGFETVLTVTDPTADRTITLPNVTGTVVTTGDTGSVTSTMILDGTILNADVNASAAIAGTKISPDFGGQTIVSSGVFSHALGSASAPTVTFTGDTNTGIYSPGADQLAISTNGTGRLFVDSTGEVRLTNGNVFTASDNTGVLALYGGGAFNGGAGVILYGSANATDANVVRFVNGSFSERMRLDSSGRLGLGTSSPVFNLVVAGSGSDGTWFNSSGTVGRMGLGAIANGAGGAFQISYDRASGLANFGVGTRDTPSTALTIDTSGRLGIGTTSPGTTLDVRGTLTVNTNQKFAQFNDGTNDVARLTYAGTGQFVIDANGPSTQSTQFWINGSERARIDSSGRLLVGTSTSISSQFSGEAKIQIAGTGIYGFSSFQYSNNTFPTVISLGKSRGASAGSHAVVQNGDSISTIRFEGSDGTGFITAAQIQAEVDGTPGTNDMPGRLMFSVTADGSASPTEAMRINNAGELLVGYTADNGAYKLQVNSQIFATSATIATSDGRYKENVATLDGCVDLVKALRPVSFDWKAQEPVTRVDEDGETVVVREAHNFPDGKQVGFIAQEVEEVLADKPWLGSVIKQNVRPAVTDADGNELAPEEEFLGIAEGNLVAVLTSALKDAIGEIESLKARVAALESV